MPAPEINVINLTEGGSQIEENESRIEELESFQSNSFAGIVNAANYESISEALLDTDEGNILTIPPGEYIINETLNVPVDNLRITSSAGAVLKIGGDTSGTLLTHLRLFNINSRTGVVIDGLTIEGPDDPVDESALDVLSSVIYLEDSNKCTIQNCIFNLAGHSTGTGPDDTYADAITISLESNDNNIIGNRIAGAGIRYSYAGASRTNCALNTITNPPHNGLSGTGNGGTPVDNIVIGNHVVSPGRMGIEDWSGIYRTQIVNNTFIGPSTPAMAHSMGISAAGYETLIQGNTARDFEDYGIESNGRGHRIIGNSCRQVDTDALLEGIGIKIDAGSDDPLGGAVVSGNYVEGYQYGINATGATGSLQVFGNTIVNCQRGIESDSTDDYHLLAIQGNSIRFTTPNDDAGDGNRYGILVSSSDGTGNVGCRIIGNTVTYETTAASGDSAGFEFAISVNTVSALVAFNTVDAHSITGSGSLAPIGISGNGSTVAGLKIIGNSFLGGSLVYINNYTAPFYFMNNKAPDAGTPVGLVTGVAVSAAGVHAALVSLGLISA